MSDDELLGDFALSPDADLDDVGRTYGLRLEQASAGVTVAEYLMQELNGPPEVGDRAPLGPVELVVRALDGDGAILEVGLALDPRAPSSPDVWARLDRLLAALRRVRRRPALGE